MANLQVTQGSGTWIATVELGGGVHSPCVNLMSPSGSPVCGTAGVPATPVLSVQGVPGGVPQPITLSSGTATLGSVFVTGTTAVLGLVAISSLPPVSVTGTSAITGAVTVIGTPSVIVSGTSNIAGSVSIISQPAPTGTTAISGAVSLVGTPAVSVTGTASISGAVAVSNIPVVAPYASSDNLVSGVTPVITGVQAVLVLPSPGPGLRNYLTSLTITNSSATTVISLRDGTNGTSIWSGRCSTSAPILVSFPAPLRQPTTGTALNCFCSITAASVIVSASGYRGA